LREGVAVVEPPEKPVVVQEEQRWGLQQKRSGRQAIALPEKLLQAKAELAGLRLQEDRLL